MEGLSLAGGGGSIEPPGWTSPTHSIDRTPPKATRNIPGFNGGGGGGLPQRPEGGGRGGGHLLGVRVELDQTLTRKHETRVPSGRVGQSVET